MNNNIIKYLIDYRTPLVDALRVLNLTGKRIIFLVDNKMLKGALTYGDVSRWILDGKSLNSTAYDASTKKPVFIHTSEIANVDIIFSEKKINAIPVIDNENNVDDIIFKEDSITEYNQINVPVAIMAGGKGTRLYPYTKILPKPLIPIGDIPISEQIINRFYKNGCRDFIFIVNYKKNMIKAYYNEIDRPYKVRFVDEDEPLGTGGGLRLIKGLVNSTFILTNCDSFIDEDYSKILSLHKEKKNLVTMICSNQQFEIPYGVIKTDDNGKIVEMKEKPTFSYLTNTGTYIVEPEVIEYINPNEYIGFPDIIQRIKDSGQNVGIYTVEQKMWLDMGQFDSMDEMKKRLNIKE